MSVSIRQRVPWEDPPNNQTTSVLFRTAWISKLLRTTWISNNWHSVTQFIHCFAGECPFVSRQVEPTKVPTVAEQLLDPQSQGFRQGHRRGRRSRCHRSRCDGLRIGRGARLRRQRKAVEEIQRNVQATRPSACVGSMDLSLEYGDLGNLK